MEAQPFQISVPQQVLDDLHHRLAITRWPDDIHDAGWKYGVDPTFMREFVGYWP